MGKDKSGNINQLTRGETSREVGRNERVTLYSIGG